MITPYQEPGSITANDFALSPLYNHGAQPQSLLSMEAGGCRVTHGFYQSAKPDPKS